MTTHISKRGAPYSKITDPDVCEFIFRCVEEGLPIKLAAAEAGINPSTVFLWRKKAEDPHEPEDSPYKAFVLGLDRARAKRLRFLLEMHKKHYPLSPQSVEFALKSEFREWYSDVKTLRADVSSRVVGKPAELTEGGGLSDDDLAFLRDDILGLSE